MVNLGNVSAGQTVNLPWNTNGADGASITRGTDGSIRIYKDNSVTQRASSSGITDSEDFDSLTGLHLVTIDLSDNADAGFYAAGHDYFVVIQGAVIDGKTVNACLGTFSIENRASTATVSAASIRSAVGLASANLDTQLGGIDSKTTNLPSDPADESLIIAAVGAISTLIGTPAGASVSADIAAITAAVDADDLADALLDRADAIETAWTLRQALRVILAALGGKVSGANTNSPTFRNATDTKNRITAVTDASGNRTSVTLDGD